MHAFHSFWSKPNREQHGGAIAFNDAELFIMILSALKWQQLNGPIRMITDSDGADFFNECGIADLWSEPISTSLDTLQSDVDSFLFWAAGKLKALSLMDAPCVMLDTDMIIWQNLQTDFGQAVICAHFEDLNDAVYPNPSVFQMKEGYYFPTDWNFSLKAANTAFLYIPSNDFRDDYVDTAFRFIGALDKAMVSPTVSMCFAEQRLLPICASTVSSKSCASLFSVALAYVPLQNWQY